MRNAVRSLVVCLVVLGGSTAFAQERGTTQGPEGSEIGKGGYVSGPGGLGGFSLTADGGGAIAIKGSQYSPPLYAGITASYWEANFYRIDLSGFYIPDPKIWGALLGPSFHTTTWPIAFSAGFQAGLHIPNEGAVNFIISPRVGMDWITESHFQLGVFANFDINLADFDRSIVRVGLSIGWRF
jgi:hypothetical protein